MPADPEQIPVGPGTQQASPEERQFVLAFVQMYVQRLLDQGVPGALLCQDPRGSKGCIIFYARWHELALEMRFPDPVHGEVPQFVYAFRGH